MAKSPLLAHQANRTPKAPPESASNKFSVSICRIRRVRPAPNDMRTAISRSRVVARASERLAMLAQAMSKTRPTTAIRICKGKAARRLRRGRPRSTGVSSILARWSTSCCLLLSVEPAYPCHNCLASRLTFASSLASADSALQPSRGCKAIGMICCPARSSPGKSAFPWTVESIGRAIRQR